ncbi:transmembrane protein 186 [Spea bombifrons]|uniref:transmembrane protein 186 n=1 Tax=Spea bombifrons TaxID=233779 RepID=UPI00234BABFE|nr:transmembrane protein 186 [Spea bombifrons]
MAQQFISELPRLHSLISSRIWTLPMNCRTNFIRRILLPPIENKYMHLRLSWPQQLVLNRQFSSLFAPKQNEEKFTLIYKFNGIQFCRVVSRFKILQTALTVLLLPPVYYYYMLEKVSFMCAIYCSGTAVFASLMLYFLSYYLQRIIGMIYLSGTGTMIKVAHLTFWGKRRDVVIPVADVKSLEETGDNKNEILLEFKRYSNQDLFYFTIRYGHILDREKFFIVFRGLH